MKKDRWLLCEAAREERGRYRKVRFSISFRLANQDTCSNDSRARTVRLTTMRKFFSLQRAIFFPRFAISLPVSRLFYLPIIENGL